MSRKRFNKLNCSIAATLEQVGDWWTLLVIREAFFGTGTFTGFRRALGISRNILTDRLQRLIEAGILETYTISPTSTRHQYQLTAKGHDLLPVLIAMMQWGDKWEHPGAEPVLLTSGSPPQPIRKIQIEDAALSPIGYKDLSYQPGPGADAQTRKRFEQSGK
jgi:DNA-binding HxlR family transcriptional regulator